MKRLITFICLIVIIFIGYILIAKGFDNSFFPIPSYKTIESKHEGLTKKLADYDRVNEDGYETVVANLNSSIKQYEESKSKYDAMLVEVDDFLKGENSLEEEEKNIIKNAIYSDQEVYRMDFLLVILGNHAQSEGVEAEMKLTSSSVTDSTASMLEFFYADMNFKVSGQYINVANFISHLENDERLSWEISNFDMESGNEGVNATFVVRNIPVDSKSYLATKVTDLNGDGTDDANSSDTSNTVDGNVVSNNVDNNTTNNVTNDTTNSVTNTVSNTVSNNTVANN